MKKPVAISALIILLIASPGFAEKIRNNNVSVRTMPGSFYPVITVLNSGDSVKVMEKKDPWRKVKTSANAVGWVSANAFNTVGGSVDYGAMARDNTKTGMSKIMVTAAAKGFFENKINDTSINKAIFENPYTNYIDPYGYNQFVNEMYSSRWSREKFYRETAITQQEAFRIEENLVALSSYICARLAAPGLSTNQALTSYVNNVAELIMESTEFYDLPVCVQVVKTDHIFANATPIGVIMISEGMLKTIRSEGELACLLGHEMSHVTLHHGAAEMTIRKPIITAEDAFDEMREELGVDENEKELDEVCNDMYERAIRGRKAEYEAAADQRGMIYARRAGYDPNGMISLLERLKTRVPASRNPEDTSHWLPNTLDKRIDALKTFSRKEFRSNKNYQDFQARYHASIH